MPFLYKTILLIGIGGGLGSVFRFILQQFISNNFDLRFPFGTFFVNSLGCLLIGLIYGLFERFDFNNQEWKLFFATGFCGGFTTFSAFSYENMQLLKQQDYVNFILYAIGSILLGLLLVMIGLIISNCKIS